MPVLMRKVKIHVANVYSTVPEEQYICKGVGEGGAAGACAPALSKVGGGAQVGLSPPTFDRPSVLI